LLEFFPELRRRQTETTMRQNEEFIRILIENLHDYAITLLDTEGKILTWSAGAERIKGYRAEEIIGKHFAAFYRREDIRENRPQRLLDEAATRGRVQDECWHLRKDGSQFWAHVVITALRDKNGQLCGFGKIVSDETHRKNTEGTLLDKNQKLDHLVQERNVQLTQANRELQESLAQLRALAARLQSVREDERSSMAREVHDELGQALTAMKMDLVWLMNRIPGSDTPLHAKANSMLNLVDETIFSVRRIASALRPGMLDDLGLAAAIEWQAQEFQGRTGIVCKLTLPEEVEELDEECSTAVFRIFQETLTNVARHAAASRVDVKLQNSGEELVLEVRDNGKGFRNEARNRKKSLGILGMRERALLLGGAFEVRGNPGRGTSVTVRIPLSRCRSQKGAEA
jgi:PAS domain S-box-containing protein